MGDLDKMINEGRANDKFQKFLIVAVIVLTIAILAI